MDISPVSKVSATQAAAVPVIPTDQAAANRDVVQAVKAVNSSGLFGEDNQLMFQRDRVAQKMVIRIVNRKTNEVVSQIPPEYVLRLAEDLKDSGS